MMKKIIFVTTTAWSCYTLRRGFMRKLKKEGFTVTFCAGPDGYEEKLEEEGFRFIPAMSDKKINPVRDLRFLIDLYRVYKYERPDAVLHYSAKPNIYGSIAAKLAGIKSISTVTGLGFAFINKGFINKVIKILYRISFRFPEAVFFQNRHDMEFFIKKGIVNRKKARLARGSGVNTAHFNPDFCAFVKRDNIDPTFLFMSRILRDKGLLELVAACKIVKNKYPKVNFWVLGPTGKGNPSDIPEDMVKSWHSEGVIEYLGTADDVRPFVCKSDAVLLPSYREGAPRSVIEAMAMGKPAIATDAIGCREIVRDGENGYLVPVKDEKGLAEAIIKFIELSPRARSLMGKKSREKAVGVLSEEAVFPAYMEIIRKALNETASRA